MVLLTCVKHAVTFLENTSELQGVIEGQCSSRNDDISFKHMDGANQKQGAVCTDDRFVSLMIHL